MTPNSDKKGIKAYDNLPCKIQREVRKELKDRLFWKTTTLYSRINGTSLIRINEVEIVEEVFAKHGLDAWTGETLFFK